MATAGEEKGVAKHLLANLFSLDGKRKKGEREKKYVRWTGSSSSRKRNQGQRKVQKGHGKSGGEPMYQNRAPSTYKKRARQPLYRSLNGEKEKGSKERVQGGAALSSRRAQTEQTWATGKPKELIAQGEKES